MDLVPSKGTGVLQAFRPNAYPEVFDDGRIATVLLDVRRTSFLDPSDTVVEKVTVYAGFDEHGTTYDTLTGTFTAETRMTCITLEPGQYRATFRSGSHLKVTPPSPSPTRVETGDA